MHRAHVVTGQVLVCLLAVAGAVARESDEERLYDDLVRFDGVLMRIRDGFVKPGDSMLTPSVINTYEKDGSPAACQMTVAIAKGRNPLMVVQTVTRRVPIAEFEAKVCDELAKVHPQFIAQARGERYRQLLKTMAPYAAAGVGGKKLELMVQYDGVYWRLPGGRRTEDPKALAAANTLFHWLEAVDPEDPRYVIHTIRRFHFNGNDLVSVSEKAYRRAKGAEPGNVFE
jgi:hypothetical protein